MHLADFSASVFLLGYAYYRISCHEFEEMFENKNIAPYKSIHLYRAASLLNKYYNLTFGAVFIPTLKTASEFLVPILAYSVTRLYYKFIDNPFIVLLPLIIPVILIYLLGLIDFLSTIHEKSLAFLREFNPMTCHRKHLRDPILIKVLIKSSRVLKVQIGGFYFVDKFLALHVLGFVLDSFIFLLIEL